MEPAAPASEAEPLRLDLVDYIAATEPAGGDLVCALVIEEPIAEVITTATPTASPAQWPLPAPYPFLLRCIPAPPRWATS